MSADPKKGFVQRIGTQFVVNGELFYFNGWNSYWLMARSVDESNRTNVRQILQQGSELGLTVCRTWAFNDGGYEALQLSPGHYDEKVFKALDYAVDEANRYGIRLLLSFVNNWDDYGGKAQYCKWAKEAGITLEDNSTDSFFSNSVVKDYFKAHIKAIVTRVNSISGVVYSEDPTIFAWELMNEPRCLADKSGNMLQGWIEEMSAYVKSLDENHMVTVGLEGFYGKTSSADRLDVNPRDWCQWLGCDYIRNHQPPSIDFTTIHIYYDSWRSDLDFDELMKQVKKWVVMHVEDTHQQLDMPLVIAEYGLSSKFGQRCQREMFRSVLDVVFESALNGGSASGSMIWQLLPEGMNEFNDGYALMPSEDTAISNLLKMHSERLETALNRRRSKQNIIEQTCCTHCDIL